VEMMRGGARGEAVAARYRRRRSTDPAVAYVHKELFADPAVVEFVAGIGDHDPIPALERLRCPVLAVFGERDTYIPVDESVTKTREALERASNADVTVLVLPDADHWLRVGETMHPEYVPTMTAWVRDRVGLGG
jgi:pimeloyl-ACP methyl ester carboxylesterase